MQGYEVGSVEEPQIFPSQVLIYQAHSRAPWKRVLLPQLLIFWAAMVSFLISALILGLVFGAFANVTTASSLSVSFFNAKPLILIPRMFKHKSFLNSQWEFIRMYLRWKTCRRKERQRRKRKSKQAFLISERQTENTVTPGSQGCLALKAIWQCLDQKGRGVL